MEETTNTKIICFNCNKNCNSITHRAFDQNFCSKECVNISIEIFDLFDYGYKYPCYWANVSKDFKEEKKNLEYQKINKICLSLVDEIIESAMDNISWEIKPNENNLNIARNLNKLNDSKNSSYQNFNILSSNNTKIYNIPLTPPKKENKKNFKPNRNNCDFIINQFGNLNSFKLKLPIFPIKIGNNFTFIPLEEWKF